MHRHAGQIVCALAVALAIGLSTPTQAQSERNATTTSAAARVQADFLSRDGQRQWAIGDRTATLASFRAALPLQRAVGDRAGEARTLSNLGVVFDALGQRDSATAYFRAALALTRAVRDRAGEATTLSTLGMMFNNQGQRDSALSVLRRAGWPQAAVATTAPGDFLRVSAVEDALGARALIVGDPAMPPDAPALPGARAEATWLADTLLARLGATLLTDRAATVGAVRARLGAAPLSHFATHAAAYPEANRARAAICSSRRKRPARRAC